MEEKQISNNQKIVLRTDCSLFIWSDWPIQIRDLLYQSIQSTPLFVRPTIKIAGKECRQKRNVGFFCDVVNSYPYSGTEMPAQKLTPELRQILDFTNKVYGSDFNGFLINSYPDGESSISYHSDSPSNLAKVKFPSGEMDAVLTISIGQTRMFNIISKGVNATITPEAVQCGITASEGTRFFPVGEVMASIPSGDCCAILMLGDAQKETKHGILPEPGIKYERISYTLRKHV